MNPLMPFLSETLYYALPGKNKTPITFTKFPEPIEVYFFILYCKLCKILSVFN